MRGGGFVTKQGGGFTSMVSGKRRVRFLRSYVTLHAEYSFRQQVEEGGREGEGERSGLRDMLFWVGKMWRVIYSLPCPAVFMAPLPSSRLLSFVSSRTLVVVIIDLLLRPSISVLFMLWYGMV